MKRKERIRVAEQLIAELEELRPQVKELLLRNMPRYQLSFSGKDDHSDYYKLLILCNMILVVCYVFVRLVCPSIDQYFWRMVYAMLMIDSTLLTAMAVAPCFTVYEDLIYAHGICWLFCSKRSIEFLTRALEKYTSELEIAENYEAEIRCTQRQFDTLRPAIEALGGSLEYMRQRLPESDWLPYQYILVKLPYGTDSQDLSEECIEYSDPQIAAKFYQLNRTVRSLSEAQ